MPNIASLHIYPIKSLGGIELDKAFITDRGFEHDRRWMLVDTERRFLSQRELAKMATFSCQGSQDFFTVSLDGDQLQIPWVPQTRKLLSTNIWSDSISCSEPKKSWSKWFEDRLGQKCHLFYMPNESKRRIDNASYPGLNSLSDGYPYLVVNEESLANLNSRIINPVQISRFRANVVIQQLDAYAEDSISSLEHDNYSIELAKPCARCIVINTDQNSGKRHKEPLATLASYRKVNGKVIFGQNALIKSGIKLSVGDNLRIK